MNIDLELREILENILNDAHNTKNLGTKYDTWQRLEKHNSLKSFKDFVIGDINGQLRCGYSTYNGKKESDLEKEENKFLDETLIQRVYGIEPVIDEFIEKNNKK
ncbi:hypothetical protein GF319_08210 [Candidatus Bathyarchaeota archaeon]|jgi:hypothetical protein|nr:hypothetical protein [Candidatus Bathyarchaeota archaeon]